MIKKRGGVTRDRVGADRHVEYKVPCTDGEQRRVTIHRVGPDCEVEHMLHKK